MSTSMSLVRNLLLYRLRGTPSGPMRNFSKFQATSFLHTGLQMISLGSFSRDTGSSFGCGSFSLRNTNSGWASFPFTSTFSRSWNFGSKPFPGRTYFRDRRISSFLQFSYMVDYNISYYKCLLCAFICSLSLPGMTIQLPPFYKKPQPQ